MENVSKEILKAANEHANYVLQQLITRVSVYQEEKGRIINSAVSDFIAGAVWAQNNEKDNKFIKSMKQVPKQLTMKVNIKLSKDAHMPTYGTSGAAGLDLYASSDVTIQPNERMLIPTGVAMEIPEGYFCYVMGRSGNTIKKGLHVALGLVDEDYRSTIGVMAFNQSDEAISFAKGDRVAQMVILPYPKVEFVEVDELSDTERGTGGYGSTGK